MTRMRPLSQGEYTALLKRLPPAAALVCRIMADTGLRISDALALTCAQVIAATGGRLVVRETKTGKTRAVRLRPRTLALARAAAAGRPLTQRLVPVHRATIYRAITRAAQALGYERVSAHSFRKLYAQRIYRRAGLEAAQRALAHSSPLTTLTYVADLEVILHGDGSRSCDAARRDRRTQRARR